MERKSNQNQPNIRWNPSKIHQHSIKITKCPALRLGSRLGSVLEASWARPRGQHSPKTASQIEGKSIRNPCKSRSTKLMPSKFEFWCIFDWIFGKKMQACWHKIASKIDANFERPILQKRLKNKWNINDLSSLRGRSWQHKSFINPPTIEAQDELPLSNDF